LLYRSLLILGPQFCLQQKCHNARTVIAFIEGLVVTNKENSVVISVGGIGIEVLCPRPTLERCQAGKPMRLETVFIVREDAMTLYGFHDHDALEVFKLLLSVSGVGPKLGLAALSSFTSNVIADAIAKEDSKLLSSISGVGKKTAERIVLELSNKMPAHLAVGRSPDGAKRPVLSENEAFKDAVEALIALGYRDAQVRTVVANLVEGDADTKAETLIRKALAKLR
jgi:holliday junction DNA helicase RuvA